MRLFLEIRRFSKVVPQKLVAFADLPANATILDLSLWICRKYSLKRMRLESKHGYAFPLDENWKSVLEKDDELVCISDVKGFRDELVNVTLSRPKSSTTKSAVKGSKKIRVRKISSKISEKASKKGKGAQKAKTVSQKAKAGAQKGSSQDTEESSSEEEESSDAVEESGEEESSSDESSAEAEPPTKKRKANDATVSKTKTVSSNVKASDKNTKVTASDTKAKESSSDDSSGADEDDKKTPPHVKETKKPTHAQKPEESSGSSDDSSSSDEEEERKLALPKMTPASLKTTAPTGKETAPHAESSDDDSSSSSDEAPVAGNSAAKSGSPAESGAVSSAVNSLALSRSKSTTAAGSKTVSKKTPNPPSASHSDLKQPGSATKGDSSSDESSDEGDGAQRIAQEARKTLEEEAKRAEEEAEKHKVVFPELSDSRWTIMNTSEYDDMPSRDDFIMFRCFEIQRNGKPRISDFQVAKVVTRDEVEEDDCVSLQLHILRPDGSNDILEPNDLMQAHKIVVNGKKPAESTQPSTENNQPPVEGKHEGPEERPAPLNTEAANADEKPATRNAEEKPTTTQEKTQATSDEKKDDVSMEEVSKENGAVEAASTASCNTGASAPAASNETVPQSSKGNAVTTSEFPAGDTGASSTGAGLAAGTDAPAISTTEMPSTSSGDPLAATWSKYLADYTIESKSSGEKVIKHRILGEIMLFPETMDVAAKIKRDLTLLRKSICTQMAHYFSDEAWTRSGKSMNSGKQKNPGDSYLIRNMDGSGWIDITVPMQFTKMKTLLRGFNAKSDFVFHCCDAMLTGGPQALEGRPVVNVQAFEEGGTAAYYIRKANWERFVKIEKDKSQECYKSGRPKF